MMQNKKRFINGLKMFMLAFILLAAIIVCAGTINYGVAAHEYIYAFCAPIILAIVVYAEFKLYKKIIK